MPLTTTEGRRNGEKRGVEVEREKRERQMGGGGAGVRQESDVEKQCEEGVAAHHGNTK